MGFLFKYHQFYILLYNYNLIKYYFNGKKSSITYFLFTGLYETYSQGWVICQKEVM